MCCFSIFITKAHDGKWQPFADKLTAFTAAVFIIMGVTVYSALLLLHGCKLAVCRGLLEHFVD